MPEKRKRPRKPPRPHRAISSTARRPSGPVADEEPELLDTMRRALSGGGAFDMLTLASQLLLLGDPRERGPMDRDEPTGPDRGELLESFLGVELVETSALLTAIGALLDDDLMRQRIRRELVRRGHAVPRALKRLEPIEVGTPWRMSHVLGDGDDYFFPIRTGAGEDLTYLAYVDFNLGRIVKDGFLIPVPVAEVVARAIESGEDPDNTVIEEVDPADARALVTEAVDWAGRMWPRVESETWPATRAILEWVLRHLPEGGTAPERAPWPEEEQDALAARFLASPFGNRHDPNAVEMVVWYGAGYGNCDPLRWSPVKAELFLLDFVPRKIMAPPADLVDYPDVLRDFVSFVHGESGISDYLTDETLAVIDGLVPEFLRAIRSPRPQGVNAIMGAMGFDAPLTGGEDDWDDADDWGDFDGSYWTADEPWEAGALRRLAAEVGGDDALNTLDTAPLPDEAFDHRRVLEDPELQARVAKILSLMDEACHQYFDVEHRTACRRLLADLAEVDPDALVRGRANTAAAAIVWLIGTANDSFQGFRGGLTVGEVMASMGVKGSASQRAGTFLKALDIDLTYGSPSWTPLGDARYLVGRERERLVEVAGRLREALR